MLRVVNLKKTVQAIGTVQIQEQPTKPDSQPFRAATVNAVGHSSSLEYVVTGGVLQSSVPLKPGDGVYITIAAAAMPTGNGRRWVFLFVA